MTLMVLDDISISATALLPLGGYYTATGWYLTTTNTVDYFPQTDGSVTNGSEKLFTLDAAGNLLNAATKAATTTDPRKALDDAISSIDKFRSLFVVPSKTAWFC